MTARDYDVVLYGATGFTGRQTVEYFARHAPAGLRWAVAARNRESLEKLREAIGAPTRDEDVIVADSRDPATIDGFVARSRVVLSTAGPFALYGTPVVDACVRFGTAYVDITGETAWVRDLIERYHARAAAERTRIIPCCGFDSVPSDIGALLMVRQMASRGMPCTEVRAYYRMRGGLNGGTVASALNMVRNPAKGVSDPFLLAPEQTPRSPRQIKRSRDMTRPRYDRELGAWTGPFVMAPTNARVVRRSAALHAAWGAPYGEDFVYQESQTYKPPYAGAKAHAVTAALGLFLVGLRVPVTRQLIARMLPKPGTGPSVATMDQGWFRCELLGLAADGRSMRGLIRNQGDPGNRSTVKFVCESALALALESDRLPGGPDRGGVLTPATGLGEVLVERLRNAGVAIEIGGATTVAGVSGPG